MPNLKDIIDSSNKTKSNTTKEGDERTSCNCTKKDQCPQSNKCLYNNIVYQATVTTDSDKETYIGITANHFKTRYANHKQSFKNEKYKNQTELSKYIWKLEDKKIDHNISWKIIKRAKLYNNISKKCNLCTTEK